MKEGVGVGKRWGGGKRGWYKTILTCGISQALVLFDVRQQGIKYLHRNSDEVKALGRLIALG